jgi:non-homologous end joining protein Ku
MVGKRVQFDDKTWAALDALISEKGESFQDLADEAFTDLLKKHHQPVGLKAALKESVANNDNTDRSKKDR